MIPNKILTNLTERQRQVIQMRYRYGWRLRQIAGALCVSEAAAHYLLRRAHVRVGLPRHTKIRIRSPKPKLLAAPSLR